MQVSALSGNKRNRIKKEKNEESTILREIDHGGSNAVIDFMFSSVPGTAGE